MKRIIILLIVAVFFVGCRTQYVPVETTKTEYVTNTVHDSVFVDRVEKDSVIIEKDGDTVTIYRTRYVFQDRWRERVVTDTLLRADSIRVPYPVEGKVKTWEKVKLLSAGAMGVLVILCGGGLLWWIRRRYKRC